MVSLLVAFIPLRAEAQPQPPQRVPHPFKGGPGHKESRGYYTPALREVAVGKEKKKESSN